MKPKFRIFFAKAVPGFILLWSLNKEAANLIMKKGYSGKFFKAY